METGNQIRKEYELEKDYFGVDTMEGISKCLNCEKEKCNNCLKHKTGV